MTAHRAQAQHVVRSVTSTAVRTAVAVTPANFDTTVSPCRDFFTYVNGGWIAHAHVPTDSMRFGVIEELNALRDSIEQHILEQARALAVSTAHPKVLDHPTLLLGQFYNSCLETAETDSVATLGRPWVPTTAARGSPARAARCVRATRRLLGDALAHAYVAVVFPTTAQIQARMLCEQLRAAMRERIRTVTWMSDSTKQRALAKLAAMTFLIGGPDHWKDYTKLALNPADYAKNVRTIAAFTRDQELDAIGTVPEAAAWDVSPDSVNAFFTQTENTVTIPAAVMQPPWFDPSADLASNYGSLGFVIGHEITHAFDNTGRLLDVTGHASDWWTAADASAFTQLAVQLAGEYNAFPFNSGHVNGELTLGEDIADLGGTAVAYDALEHALEGVRPRLDAGFTPEQRFFIAQANAFRETYSSVGANQASGDVHAPVQWRVNGTLMNLPAFTQSFGCRASDAMVQPPNQRVRIW